MVSFEDDEEPNAGSDYESQDEDEKMEDADADADGDADGDDADGDNEDDNEDNEEDEDDQDEDEADSPTQSQSQRQEHTSGQNGQIPNPTVLLTSPSPRPSGGRSPYPSHSLLPNIRPEALTASVYDIVPTMAAPQSTSINCVSSTPDMRWVFSGGSDGYIRMYNWVETANGKVPLTVAQKHPFVDSVMKAGSLTTYWENEESSIRTPPAQSADEPKDSSPVYSLATQGQAVWLLSGLESGAINLQTCRHQAGTRIATLREHTSAVSVLKLAQDEQSVLSGSWDKKILDWDLNTGRVKRSYLGSGSQISAIEMRPTSSLPIPHITEEMQEERNTFASNNASKPASNGIMTNGVHAPSRRGSRNTEHGTDDAAGSADGSLFGDNDHGSLFGDNDDAGNNGGGGGFGDDDDDEFSKAIANGLQEAENDDAAAADEPSQDEAKPEEQDQDVTMADVSQGGPVQPPDLESDHQAAPGESGVDGDGSAPGGPSEPSMEVVTATTSVLAHSEEDPSSALTNGVNHIASDDAPPSSESTFLDAAIDGTIRIWDRRVSQPIARIMPPRNTPPWCMGACWSPDGNTFYAGRRNGTVDEYSMHKGLKMANPSRTFRFPTGSGAVSAVRSMPNGKHLICASYDILRLYDLREQENTRHSAVPFLIVPGHRTGVISALYIDPTCKFMISTAGNRGWEGNSTEVLLGYEIGVPNITT